MNARYPDMSDLQLAMTARFANKYKLDTADVRQELEIIKIECAGTCLTSALRVGGEKHGRTRPRRASLREAL